MQNTLGDMVVAMSVLAAVNTKVSWFTAQLSRPRRVTRAVDGSVLANSVVAGVRHGRSCRSLRTIFIHTPALELGGWNNSQQQVHNNAV